MFHAGAWAEAAAKLGLGCYEHVAPYERGASFSRLKRALGDKANSGSHDAWMYGKWRTKGSKRGVEVLALVHVVSGGVDNVYFTHTVARIDPAFRLGLDVRPKRGGPPLGLCAVAVDAVFNAELAVGALAPSRAELALRRAAPEGDALDLLVDIARRWDVQVTDGTVDVFTRDLGATPTLAAADLAKHLAERLEAAALAAKSLARRDRDVDPLEASWATFAEAEKLTLDRERMLITGEVGGVRLRIGIEGEPGALYTVVVAEWPKLLGAGLRLGRHGPLDALADLVAPQDVRVGDRAFDDVFLLRGDP
ncbi:MAG TPA: hypothetical protein VIF62_02670, partial [Labilithrix sp.]